MCRDDTVLVQVLVAKAYDASMLVEVIDGDRFIIPRSQLRDGTTVDEEGDEGVIAIPRWLARDRAIAYGEVEL
jgi:hypothetical protein